MSGWLGDYFPVPVLSGQVELVDGGEGVRKRKSLLRLSSHFFFGAVREKVNT